MWPHHTQAQHAIQKELFKLGINQTTVMGSIFTWERISIRKGHNNGQNKIIHLSNNNFIF